MAAFRDDDHENRDRLEAFTHHQRNQRGRDEQHHDETAKLADKD